MGVSGYKGNGLVNSYYGGDSATGSLTSAEFRIERNYITFLGGGGKNPAALHIDLVVDGRVARSATGLNDRPGGSEALEPDSWDDGEPPRSFEIELADSNPDWWAPIDVGFFRGKKATLRIDRLGEDSLGFKSVELSDTIRASEPLHAESLRPRFHFTPVRGWTNDPNGLVFYKGEYHLFFQHNPYGVPWGNMTWGHAVSSDLLRWQSWDEPIHPDALGTIYSGSAVVDWNNTAGFQTGDEATVVCIYTSAGGTSPLSAGRPFAQSIAFRRDRGRTWTKFAGNPVLGHRAGENRDPKVIWHAPAKRWIMALYLEGDRYALFGSPNLKEWAWLSDVPPLGASECPDLFELPVDGDANDRRWVFWGANNNYILGQFDGAERRLFMMCQSARSPASAGPRRWNRGTGAYNCGSSSTAAASNSLATGGESACRVVSFRPRRRGEYP
jgi:hypothetical protein